MSYHTTECTAQFTAFWSANKSTIDATIITAQCTAYHNTIYSAQWTTESTTHYSA